MLKETGLLVSQSGQTGLFSGLEYFSAEYLGQAIGNQLLRPANFFFSTEVPFIYYYLAVIPLHDVMPKI